jgi:flagellar M-ring protein FliF
MNQDIFRKFKELLNRLSQRNRIVLASVTAIVIFSLIMIFVWANRPEYSLLYSKLEAGDASQIVDDLKASSIPYKLVDGGSSIMVPKKFIYELRLKYAGQNLVSSGNVGYELFDKNNLGLTDFMQKINLKRALEGELSNTINQIDVILQSRVHLVLPEKALFEDEEVKATASVILKLQPKAILERQQVMGIARLVASSVEGLSAENVVIVDTFGHVLSKNDTREDEIGLSSSQYELQHNVEKYLAHKAQAMLDKVLGVNNSIVRVNAELNFEKVKRTTESIDPENTAVLSEERNEERSTRTDTTMFQRENTITNYEMNKVVETYEGSLGQVERLAVAVFVNGVREVDAEGVERNVPRSEEEITIITEIVRTAVGFAANRGDQVVVQQLEFDQTTMDREREILASIEQKETVNQYAKIGLVIVGALIMLYVLRSVFKKIGIDEYIQKQRKQLLGEMEQQLAHKGEVSEEKMNERMAEEQRKRIEVQDRMTKEIKEFTTGDAERSARILRYWILDREER